MLKNPVLKQGLYTIYSGLVMAVLKNLVLNQGLYTISSGLAMAVC
jgi:hypothetical protein